MMPFAVDTAVQLIPASRFTIGQLTAVYNQTRVDYMVPMPMNEARLLEYIRIYDVDLDRSLVAMGEGQMLGVAMLGVREDRAWMTRLGVIRNTRRSGVGLALCEGLLEQAGRIGIQFHMLEVIKNNVPAHSLFLKLGFYEVGELLVLRRSLIIPPPDPVIAEALDLVVQDRGTQPWTNQPESLGNAAEVSGLRMMLVDGSRGWLVYQRQKFLLIRFAFKTQSGNPVEMARAFL